MKSYLIGCYDCVSFFLGADRFSVGGGVGLSASSQELSLNLFGINK